MIMLPRVRSWPASTWSLRPWSCSRTGTWYFVTRRGRSTTMALASRIWAMPNHHTFRVPPLLDVVMRYKAGVWVDPFAGWNSPAELTNDLNPLAPTDEHV